MRVMMMLTPHVSFGSEWARAAARVADVITVDPVDRLRFTPLRDARHAAVVPGSQQAYEVERVPKLLGRLMLRWRAHEQARRILQLHEHIERHVGRIDVVHTHFYANAYFVPYFTRQCRAPVVRTEHSPAFTPDALLHKRISRSGLRYARRSYAAAAQVVAVSRYLREHLRRALPGRVTVIGNPVDIEHFRPAATRQKHSPGIHVVSVGRLEKDKGIDRVIRAFDSAVKHDTRLHLQIIGDGPDAQALRSLADALPSGDRITFAGRCSRESTAARVRASHIYLSGARVETFGVAVAEGLAAGLPVVAPELPALRELISDARGVLVRPDNDHALGDALLAVARALDDYRPEAISRWVRDRFSYDAVGARLFKVYESVTGAQEVRSQ